MLIYGQDAFMASWVCRQLRLKPYPDGLYRAVGIAYKDRLVGAVVWHNYLEDNSGNPLLIEATLATVDKHWATRHNLAELFSYPFRQLRVKRVQATCGRKAKRVRSTLSRLGFHFEGIIREASPYGGDAAHYSMLHNECKWIMNHGKIIAVSASRARSSHNSGCADQKQSGNGFI